MGLLAVPRIRSRRWRGRKATPPRPARRRASALLHELRRRLSRSGGAVLGVGTALELGEEDLAVVAQLLAHPDLGRVVTGDRERLDGLEELDADLVGEGLVLRRAHD